MSNMEDDMRLAEEFLRTMLDFLEHGSVDSLVEEEVKNYFQMTKQVEIYYEKFRLKGYWISMEPTNGQFSLTRIPVKGKYDLSRLADKLFVKFCRPTIPTPLFSKALDAFIKCFGAQRLSQCVQELGGMRRTFNLDSIIANALQSQFNIDAALFMEGYEQILIGRPNAETRVYDIFGELILEVECAETVVSMFAVEKEVEPENGLKLKKLLLQRLQQKFKKEPDSPLWIKFLSSLHLTEGASSYEPLIHFIFDILKTVTSSLSAIDVENKSFHSPPGCLTYKSLIRIITKLHRNKKCCQHVVNFIFNQCAIDPIVWNCVLNSCHNPATEVVTKPAELYDYTTPSTSRLASIEWHRSST